MKTSQELRKLPVTSCLETQIKMSILSVPSVQHYLYNMWLSIFFRNGDLIHHNRPHSRQKPLSLVHLVIEILDPLRQGFSQLIPKILWISKMSWSGKKVFKHLILCISMTNKVIEYIEIPQNTQILKIAVFVLYDFREHQK